VIAAARIFFHGVYEVPPLATRASLDGRHILELKADHGHASFEDLLDLVSIYPGIHDKPYPQAARLLLYNLKIPYLVPENALFIAEYVAKKRSPSP
jgi:hypothetical protein